MSLRLLTKQPITSLLYINILRGCFEGVTEFYEYIRTCSADKLLLHHIDTLTNINVKIYKCELPAFFGLPNHDSYQSLATALLPFFQSI